MQCPKCKLELRVFRSVVDGDNISQDFKCINPKCENFDKIVKHREIIVTDPKEGNK